MLRPSLGIGFASSLTAAAPEDLFEHPVVHGWSGFPQLLTSLVQRLFVTQPLK